MRSLAVRALACTGAAVSVVTPAHAVTLGDLTVESALGQPLNARVPVTLSPGEFIGAACVSTPPAKTTDLGGLPRPVVTVPETSVPGIYELRVTTTQPLYEPMYELQLQVQCAGTPLLVRQYVLMLDLPTAMPQLTQGAAAATATPSIAPAPLASAPPAPTSPARPPHPRHPVALGAPIAPGSHYRVVAGDTLSTIAARISDRGGHGIWQTADAIFAANAHAFIGGNQDLIKLGSEIEIPAAGTTTPAPGPAAAVAAPVAAPVEAPQAVAPAPAIEPPVAVTAAAAEEPIAAAPVPEPAAPVSAPVFQDEQPVVAPPRPVAERPATVAEPAQSNAPPWLAALVGLLIGACASLVLLRERVLAGLRKRFARPVAATAAPAAAVAPAPRPAPVPVQVGRHAVPRESTMVVVEERHEETEEVSDPQTEQTDRTLAYAPGARSLPDAALDNELSSLFGDESELAGLEAPGADVLAVGDELDLDLSAAAADVTVDQDIGWIGDETALAPTQQAGALPGTGGDTAEHVDLQTLSEKATDNAKLSQTLKDALNLLESDYEDELTASQVVDKGKLQQILDDGDQDDTMVRTGTDRIPRR